MIKLKSRGITLIEILITMAISGIIFASAITGFMILRQSINRNNISAQLHQELESAFSHLADLVRAKSVDYFAYEDGLCDSTITNKLCLQDANIFEFNSSEKLLYLNNEPLFSQQLFSVENAEFYIFPEKNPLTNLGNQEYQFQPLVSIKLKVRSKLFESIQFSVQTSLSSRIYK